MAETTTTNRASLPNVNELHFATTALFDTFVDVMTIEDQLAKVIDPWVETGVMPEDGPPGPAYVGHLYGFVFELQSRLRDLDRLQSRLWDKLEGVHLLSDDPERVRNGR